MPLCSSKTGSVDPLDPRGHHYCPGKLRRITCTRLLAKEPCGATRKPGHGQCSSPTAIRMVYGRAVYCPHGLPLFLCAASQSKIPNVPPTLHPKGAPISCGNTAICALLWSQGNFKFDSFQMEMKVTGLSAKELSYLKHITG